MDGAEMASLIPMGSSGTNDSYSEGTDAKDGADHMAIEDILRVLPLAPHAFLWIVAPVYFLYFMSMSKTPCPVTRLTKMKTSGIFALATLTLVHMTRDGAIQASYENLSGQLFPHWAKLVSFIICLFLMRVEKQCGSTSSLPLFVFWGVMLMSDSVTFYKDHVADDFEHEPISFILSICCLMGTAIECILVSMQDSQDEQANVHPEELCSVPGSLTLNWVSGIIWRGFKTELKEEDVPAMALQDRCQTLCPSFDKALKNEREQQDLSQEKMSHDETTKPSTDTSKIHLLRVLVKHFGAEFFVYQLIKLFFELTQFSEPVLIGCLLNYIQHKDTLPAWNGYAILITMFITDQIKHMGHSRVWTSVDRLAKKVKTSLQMAVYKKALTAKNEGKQYLTTGEITSLVSDDCDKLVSAGNHVFFILATPIQLVLSFYMLYNQLGMGALIGLSIMIALVPLNIWIGKILKKLEKDKEDIKDKRVKMMNEILNGIKVLKLYAWENSFMKKTFDIRDQEVTAGKKIAVCHAGLDFMFCAIPFMVRVGGFMTFIYIGGYLDPAKAAMASSLFNLMNRPISIMALVLPMFVQAASAITKLSKFLSIDDIPDDIIKRQCGNKMSVNIKEGTFTWDRSKTKNCIENIDFHIGKGKLIAVVGVVGSGKSSLLSAMLGEMEKVKGEVYVDGNVAYVPQEAWILNRSLKENIVFGSSLSAGRYDKVVDACALRSDLKLLSSGDKTLIGEKGITLSGGQKQRVSLARAVYSNADVFLLDDPLSAVDSHVGKHIFDHVIGNNGLLHDKTRVMVTHSIHWLPLMDDILVMKDGMLQESGTYKQLLYHDGAFAQFIRDVAKSGKVEKTTDQKLQKGINNIFARINSLDENIEYVSSDEDEPEDDKTVSEKENPFHFNKDRKRAKASPKNKKIDEDVTQEEECESNDDVTQQEECESNDAVEEDEEDVNKGSVSKQVYLEYLKPVGFKYFAASIVVWVAYMIFEESKGFTLANWSDDDLLSNQSLTDTQEYVDKAWSYIGQYSFFGLGEVLLSFTFICLVLCRGCEAAKHHHNKLLLNILRCPMSFFDTTPTGRIINRFSKDIASVDGLGHCLRGYVCSVGCLTMNMVMTIYNIPGMIPYLIPIAVVYLAMNRIFLTNIRQLRRYRTKSKSPVFVHLGETLNGTESVRAFGAQSRFITKMEEKLENQMKFEMTEHWFWSWFHMRITILSSLVSLMSGLLLIWDNTISAGIAGMLLGYSTNFVRCLGWVIHHSTHTETELISLERVIEYSNIPTEAAWETEENAVQQEWPESGDLIFDDYQTRYRDGLDLVLKGVTCNIKSGEKIGIVGRTGAGKSSLTVALFRLIEASKGNISFDGQNVGTVGLHDLRNKLTILPQDPVIFGGTLRMNLDPFGEKTTEELWETLKHSHLKTFVEGLPDKLEHECGEGGKNLSMGQRQLVCLARALLRKSQVLVLDEATAGVDMETDELIQKTIRKEFEHHTVLTIAHRLNTVMDYDRIMVLDQGQIKEFDSPKKLLANQESSFYSMAKDANLV